MHHVLYACKSALALELPHEVDGESGISRHPLTMRLNDYRVTLNIRWSWIENMITNCIKTVLLSGSFAEIFYIQNRVGLFTQTIENAFFICHFRSK